ncbi:MULTISPECIES: hypothetical protein [Halomicrobium]|uniref:Zinc ribbon domain-containing protein n=2 Tax=Halomicrobium mukohataei TaxID=57705 RepID=C7P3N0_HALMD|nr:MULTISPECIES: hypothetical protein [Halomicrobium]ACV47702.1 conserved hypothetical protein [Halomicrobium mukohataei DSM 12286]QCD66155.1 hypothetical protein E5139_11065 [Halomicrobium mukohataei]QFR20960.1 hypothetical protein GBQ70_11060 [Halomicrobium sp. ZPS1]
MVDTATDAHTAAVDAIADRRYERAGDEYTRAARATLADPHDGQHPFEPDENGWIGDGLRLLATAAVAYRVAEADERATHRCVEGVAVARDLEHVLEHPVQRACLAEFVADYRVVGDVGDPHAAYADAVDAYEAADAESPQRWATTPLFEAAAATIKQVARGLDDGEIAITWEDLHGADPNEPGRFLAHRAQFKRQRFPSLLAHVVDDGTLAASRGTTEYNNANFRCPECGSTDVNWVADRTLCMRCSTPMERSSR